MGVSVDEIPDEHLDFIENEIFITSAVSWKYDEYTKSMMPNIFLLTESQIQNRNGIFSNNKNIGSKQKPNNKHVN